MEAQRGHYHREEQTGGTAGVSSLVLRGSELLDLCNYSVSRSMLGTRRTAVTTTGSQT